MQQQQRQPFRQVSRSSVERCGPGETVVDPEPGDFILTHGDAIISKIIRLGQRLRIHGTDGKYTHWNHAALIADTDGGVIEALGRGITRRDLSDYVGTEYHVVRIDAAKEDRAQAVAFAASCVGQPYAWFTIISISLSLLTGGKFSFGFEGQHICSGLVARALERTAAIFNRMPTHIMPADLAKYYDVEPPPSGTNTGVPPRKA